LTAADPFQTFNLLSTHGALPCFSTAAASSSSPTEPGIRTSVYINASTTLRSTLAPFPGTASLAPAFIVVVVVVVVCSVSIVLTAATTASVAKYIAIVEIRIIIIVRIPIIANSAIIGIGIAFSIVVVITAAAAAVVSIEMRLPGVGVLNASAMGIYAQ